MWFVNNFYKVGWLALFSATLCILSVAEPLTEKDQTILSKLKAAPNQTEVQRIIYDNYWITAAHTGGLNGFLKRSLGNGFASLRKETQASLLTISRSPEFSVVNPGGILARHQSLFDPEMLAGVELSNISHRMRRPSLVEIVRPDFWPTYSFLLWPFATFAAHTQLGGNAGHLLLEWSLTPLVSMGVQKIADILIREPETHRRAKGLADLLAVTDLIKSRQIPISESLFAKLKASVGENFYKFLHKGDGSMDRRQLPGLAKLRDALSDLAEHGEFTDFAVKEDLKRFVETVDVSVKQVEKMGELFAGGVVKDLPDVPSGGGGIIGLAQDSADRLIRERNKDKAPPPPPAEELISIGRPAEGESEWLNDQPSEKKQRLVAIRQDKATPNRIALYMRDGLITLELPVDQYREFEGMDAGQRAAFMKGLLRTPGVWLHSAENPGYFRFIAVDDFSDIPGKNETEFSLWVTPVGKNRKMLLGVSQRQDEVFTREQWQAAFQAEAGCPVKYGKLAGGYP